MNNQTLPDAKSATGYSQEEAFFHELNQQLIKQSRKADLTAEIVPEKLIETIESADDKSLEAPQRTGTTWLKKLLLPLLTKVSQP